MFEADLKELERKLNIPYPERADFMREIAGDLEERYQKYLADGMSADVAKCRALNEINLSQENITELSEVHEGAVSKVMRRMPHPWDQYVRDYSGIVPLVIFALFSLKEFSMMEFLREGGIPFIIAVLVVGGFGISLNLKHAFRWFVVRDHSRQSLADFSHGPLYLAAAALLLGVLTTAAGYRIVFAKWAEGGVPDAVIRAGLSEPLAGMIVAAAIAGIIVLLHGWLATWRQRIQWES
jgi:hypothetical protein